MTNIIDIVLLSGFTFPEIQLIVMHSIHFYFLICNLKCFVEYQQHQGEFNWSSSQKALVLGSFFYGYICTQILGGFLAGRFV